MRILALIPEASCARASLAVAASAARLHPGTEIAALHVRVDPLKIFSSDEEVAFQRLREPREGTAEQRALETRRAFDDWLATVPETLARTVEYHEVAGAEEESVIRASEAADLLAMARPHNLDGHDAFHAAVFRSRKPLLLAPADWEAKAGPHIEQHMLIAWKETEQAYQAVAGALPWLRTAGRVTVLTVTKEGQPLDTAGLMALLADAGIAAEALRREPILGRTSAQIVATAAEIGASAIVMGAYRYGSIIEWALGATTKRTIAEANVPLLLAH
jgi:nucleotide-binding universal stress UspA family protein